MTRSKKVFAAIAAVFLLLLVYASYDISRKTTFPGSKPQLKERLKRTYTPQDSAKTDTLRVKRPNN